MADITALESLRELARTCTACELHKTRTQIVWGVGNVDNPLVAFVGEAPGATEDKQGAPFVGRAGKMLTEWIEWMGLTRDQVYIFNPLLCRPPSNRNPLPEELRACAHWFQAQLEAVQPRILVALGRVAAQTLVRQTGLAQLIGCWHTYQAIPVRVTYHPAYVGRKPSAKTSVYADLMAVRQRVDELLST